MLKRAEKNVLYTIVATSLIGLMGMRTSFSEETTKKAGRAIEDKTCELLNGKMECAAKRVKNDVLNTTDRIEDAVE
jgi:Cys-tRNA synthase (O-phospho-L-seryl-tRNA:Cys-tRNA synthase)